MTKTLPAPPDWFDKLWEQFIAPKLPIYLRGESVKNSFRSIVRELSQAPEAVRAVVALARIGAILQGTQGVLEAPDPSPEQVADAVQRLVERMKS